MISEENKRFLRGDLGLIERILDFAQEQNEKGNADRVADALHTISLLVDHTVSYVGK